MTIQTYFPGAKPTLMLDFSNVGYLDPRIVFTRPTTSATVVGTGTYYDDASVSKSDENLLVYSQQFDNIAWTASNITVAPDIIDVAPDDTATAETFTATAANGTVTQSVTLTTATDYTFSVYLKRRTGTGNIDITCDSAGSWVTQSITSSWARYTITQNLSIGSKTPGIRIVTNGDAIDVWGAQLEQRNFATIYRQTTTLPFTFYVATLVTAPENTPRFIHNSISRFPLGLLMEDSSTNLITYSEDFSNPIYVKTNCSASTNVTIAPSGALAADKLSIGSGTSINVFNFVSVTLVTADTYVISCYAKRVEYNFLFLGFNTSSTEYAAAQFNLSNGTVQYSEAVGTGYSIISAAIANVTNQWYRCSIVLKSNNVSENLQISPSSVAWTGGSRPGSGQNGNNFNGILVWGAQLEHRPSLTSYIATSGSAVTRTADEAYISGSNLININGNTGTFLCTYSLSRGEEYAPVFSLDDGTADNQIVLYTQSNQTTFSIVNGSVIQCTLTLPNIQFAINKTAFAYLRNYFAQSTNYATAVTDFTGLPPESVNILRIGSDVAGAKFNGAILKIAYYPIQTNTFQVKNLTV